MISSFTVGGGDSSSTTLTDGTGPGSSVVADLTAGGGCFWMDSSPTTNAAAMRSASPGAGGILRLEESSLSLLMARFSAASISSYRDASCASGIEQSSSPSSKSGFFFVRVVEERSDSRGRREGSFVVVIFLQLRFRIGGFDNVASFFHRFVRRRHLSGWHRRVVGVISHNEIATQAGECRSSRCRCNLRRRFPDALILLDEQRRDNALRLGSLDNDVAFFFSGLVAEASSAAGEMSCLEGR
mmetsp:Transcript_40675/g.85169  ORF Transcript_40675/g.85169 Transcript_40675/m.85169 type:complete len:242 (-) Transcript_40675:404-1129(-)